MQNQSHTRRDLILASGSPYRKLLLERLGLRFEVRVSEVDETPLPGEAAEPMVSRLASAKALAVARNVPEALVIGSDQVAVQSSEIVGKPGSVVRAAEQLRRFSGRTVHFLSAYAVICLETGFEMQGLCVTEASFRSLSEDEIQRYLAADSPVDCAGALRSEALGVSLLRSLSSEDPTAIIGLPLIGLSKALRAAGLQVP